MKKVKLLCVLLPALLLALVFPSSAQAVWTGVDNFDGYLTGSLNTVASPPWTEVGRTVGWGATIGTGGGWGNYLTVKPSVGDTLTDPTNVAYRGISPTIPNADTATTLFTRIRPDSVTTNSSFGLSILAAPLPANYGTGSFNDLNVQIRVNAAGGLPVFNVRNGGVFTANYTLTLGQWYNVWAVINQSTDRFDVYLTTGWNDAVSGPILYSALNNGFRVAAPTDLVSFMAVSQGNKALPNNNQLSMDDIYLSNARDLTIIPEPATIALLGLGGLALIRRKRA